MKKLLLAVFITAFSLSSATAQESIGFTAGYSSINTSYGLSFGSESDSPSKSGFFLGFFKEFELSEKYDLKTELSLGMYNKDGEKTNVLLLPVLFKYNVINGLALLFGPQLDYVLDTKNNDTLNKLGVGVGLGLEINLSKQIFINSKYTIGVSERLKNNAIAANEVDFKLDYLTIGLGYRF